VRLDDELLGQRPKNGSFLTVAIDGRGGSGKSTLADLIRAHAAWTVISGDDWFEPLDADVRWGDFNEERFRADVVVPTRLGHPPLDRPYSWAERRVIDNGQHSTSAPVVVERCFLFDCGIDWDLLVWVDTPRDECLDRARARDLVEADRLETVWSQLWQPAEDRYIERIRPTAVADVVIDGTSPLAAQLGLPE
jgi:uridine kinase